MPRQLAIVKYWLKSQFFSTFSFRLFYSPSCFFFALSKQFLLWSRANWNMNSHYVNYVFAIVMSWCWCIDIVIWHFSIVKQMFPFSPKKQLISITARSRVPRMATAPGEKNREWIRFLLDSGMLLIFLKNDFFEKCFWRPEKCFSSWRTSRANISTVRL